MGTFTEYAKVCSNFKTAAEKLTVVRDSITRILSTGKCSNPPDVDWRDFSEAALAAYSAMAKQYAGLSATDKEWTKSPDEILEQLAEPKMPVPPDPIAMLPKTSGGRKTGNG